MQKIIVHGVKFSLAFEAALSSTPSHLNTFFKIMKLSPKKTICILWLIVDSSISF